MQKGNIIELTITKLLFTGVGIGYYDGYTVLVEPGMSGIPLPEEIWKVRVTKIKNKNKNKGNQVLSVHNKGKIEAVPVECISNADYEIKPRCSIFKICGGCMYQHVPYERQLAWKQMQINDFFEKLYKYLDRDLDLTIIAPISYSENIWRYRNKMEYSFADISFKKIPYIYNDQPGSVFLGLKPRGLFTKVISPEDCFLQADIANIIRNVVVNFAKQSGLPAYNYKENVGYYKFLIIRSTANQNNLSINLVVSKEYKSMEPDFRALKETLLKISDISKFNVSILISRTAERSSSSITDDIEVLHGSKFMEEKLLGLTFKVDPFAFFQTNIHGAEILYTKVLDLLAKSDCGTVFDLYSGTGSIGQIVAGRLNVSHVYAIEEHPGAVSSSMANAEFNKLVSKWRCVQGQVENELPLLMEKLRLNPAKLAVILDPPRNGLHPKALDTILNLKARYLCYVSCNLSTLVRDLEKLCTLYEIETVMPVDMFPHTAHIEVICGLKLKK